MSEEKEVSLNRQHTNVMSAILTASMYINRGENDTLSKLTPNAVHLGMYFCQKKIKSKKSFSGACYYRNIGELSENIRKKLASSAASCLTSDGIESAIDIQKDLKKIATSSLSDALTSLCEWGIIEYETNVEPLTNELKGKHNNKKGIRIALKKDALLNVSKRIAAIPTESPGHELS